VSQRYRQLSLDERRRLFRLVDARVPIAKIATSLDRHRSTIYREIRRNRIQLEPWLRRYRFHEHGYVEGYFPVTAQDLAHERRQRLSKLRRDAGLRDHVISKLRACWSPQQIAGRLQLEPEIDGTLCHETIYRYVYGPEGRAADLYRLLPASRRQRRPHYARKPRPSFVPAVRSIAHRPTEVASRQSFGHWEADLLIFRRQHGKANLTSMVERQSRFTLLLPNPDRQSRPLVSRIGQALAVLPAGSCRTITFDRGTEFASYPLLTSQFGAEAYFCDPHAPWQKGSVENTNGRLRRFLPDERNPAELAESELEDIMVTLNGTPRRCLGYRMPVGVFNEQLACLKRSSPNL
jgi:IS30 family transposase